MGAEPWLTLFSEPSFLTTWDMQWWVHCTGHEWWSSFFLTPKDVRCVTLQCCWISMEQMFICNWLHWEGGVFYLPRMIPAQTMSTIVVGVRVFWGGGVLSWLFLCNWKHLLFLTLPVLSFLFFLSPQFDPLWVWKLREVQIQQQLVGKCVKTNAMGTEDLESHAL